MVYPAASILPFYRYDASNARFETIIAAKGSLCGPSMQEDFIPEYRSALGFGIEGGYTRTSAASTLGTPFHQCREPL